MHNENNYIDPRDALKTIGSQDFLNLGVEQVAYIKGIKDGNDTNYAVCGADGKVLSILPTEQAALSAIINNDMDVITLH